MSFQQKKTTHLANIEMQEVEDCVLWADGELDDSVGKHLFFLIFFFYGELPDSVGKHLFF